MSVEEEILRQRLESARQIEALGFNPYGHRFDFTHTVARILEQYGSSTAGQLEQTHVDVSICGRVQTIRRMGKAGFAHLTDGGERLQIYVRKDAVPPEHFTLYKKHVDIGDIIGAEGYLFRTRTHDLSGHVGTLHFLASRALPQEGQEGFSRPRTRCSNSWPQDWQVYS